MFEQGTMRTFESGATRDTDNGKLDYEGFLSPLVLERYARYMHKHRKQSDGTLRASDNWQKGIPRQQYVKSLVRHVIEFWRFRRRYEFADSQALKDQIEFWRFRRRYEFAESQAVNDQMQDLACAIMFNIMGWLHETLMGRDAK